ncbi:MAG: hypothetical protein P8R54_11685 [Myxococcota bacterium]|nr:hypothetical protein [Myxococcota bacterium]
MARQLTPEALRVIQLRYGGPPSGEDYETAETIVDGRPMYGRMQDRTVQKPPLYVVPSSPSRPLPERVAEPVVVGRWWRLVSALRRWLAGG